MEKIQWKDVKKGMYIYNDEKGHCVVLRDAFQTEADPTLYRASVRFYERIELKEGWQLLRGNKIWLSSGDAALIAKGDTLVQLKPKDEAWTQNKE